jgi:glycosyltransferase involved in cell wall biosynthesis
VKKIAIGLEYPCSLGGGVSVICRELITRLAQDYEIYLVSNDTSEQIKHLDEHDILAGHFPWLCGERPSPEDATKLSDWLKQNKVSLLHLHCGGLYSWGYRNFWKSVPSCARRVGIPCIWTSHSVGNLLTGYCGPQKPLWFKLGTFPIAWFAKIHMLRQLEIEVAVSQHDASILKSRFRPQMYKFRQIYHSRLQQIPSNNRPQQARSYRILNVGHIAFRKGQHILAEAFARIANDFPEWELLFAGFDAGDGCWQAIEKIRASYQLGDRVKLLGNRSDVYELMQDASIYAQPSLEEALGLALQEAMANACACIGSDAGGIPELICYYQNGLLVTKNSVEELANALRLMIEKPDLREKFAKQGPCHLAEQGMTSPQMVEKYKEIYQNILAQRRNQ